MSNGIEAAQTEFERWRRRERQILDAIKEVENERRRLDLELAKVDQQVTYYDSLTRDMKRELGGPGLSNLLSSLRRS